MKKILLLLIGLTIISCGNTTDPIIGTWIGADSSLVFNSNGSFEGISDDDINTGTWENNDNNFDLLNKIYSVKYDGETIKSSFFIFRRF